MRSMVIINYLNSVFLPGTIAITYWLLSRPFTGPAYLADEIGYLSNAAFLAGYTVDGGSSYHAGYSLFIAPLFVLCSDYQAIWRAVLLLNAVLWGGTFFLLHQVIRNQYPDIPDKYRTLVLLTCAFYPAWATMSGYAFPTSAVVFCFLLSIYLLIKIDFRHTIQALPFSIVAGYLFWLHPTGFAAVVASVFCVGSIAYRQRSAGLIVIHTFTVVAMVLSYRMFLQPWMLSEMTPEGLIAQTHYPGVGTVIDGLFDVKRWPVIIATFLGQLSYITIGSFGLAAIGLFASWIRSRRIFIEDSFERSDSVSLYILITTACAVGIGATSVNPVRLDQWFYGRYVDAFILPSIAFGTVTFFTTSRVIRAKVAALLMALVVLSGTIIFFSHIPGQENILLNIPAFWPLGIFADKGIFTWFAIGALGIFVVNFFPKYLLLIPVLAVFFVCIFIQTQWHTNILIHHSKPSSLVELITTVYPKDTCIATDPDIPQHLNLFYHERISLYRFYFYKFRYQRMKWKDWLKNCEGPYLTYNPTPLIKYNDIYVVARESASGLFLVTNKKDSYKFAQLDVKQFKDLRFVGADDIRCFLAGSFEMIAEQLSHFSLVGTFDGQLLKSVGRSGYLFFGPYKRLEKGAYQVVLHCQTRKITGASLDVVGNKGKVVYATAKLNEIGCRDGKFVLPFVLNDSVLDIEIRLKVDSEDVISVQGYEINMDGMVHQ